MVRHICINTHLHQAFTKPKPLLHSKSYKSPCEGTLASPGRVQSVKHTHIAHTYTYTYTYIYTYMYVYLKIYIYILYIHTYVYVYIYIYIDNVICFLNDLKSPAKVPIQPHRGGINFCPAPQKTSCHCSRWTPEPCKSKATQLNLCFWHRLNQVSRPNLHFLQFLIWITLRGTLNGETGQLRPVAPRPAQET